MSLSAKIDKRIFYSPDVNWDFAKDNIFKCICCNGDMLFHRNLIGKRIAHFVHKVPCQFENEPESEEHIMIKKWLYDNISDKFKKYLPDSFFIGNQKPDVYIELNNLKIAIEVQCSKISLTNFLERTRGYTNKGIYVFWLLGKRYSQIDEKRVSEFEKKLHFLNFGRVYCFNDSFGGYIQPYHFERVIRTNDNCENCLSDFPCDRCEYGGITFRYPKTLRNINLSKQTYNRNISFLTFDNNGIKLARMWDRKWWKSKNE